MTATHTPPATNVDDVAPVGFAMSVERAAEHAPPPAAPPDLPDPVEPLPF